MSDTSTGHEREDETRERHHRRKGEILDAAARIFHDKGYERASIQDVAESVGILKGSLYYYIDSKEELLFEVVKEVHRIGLASLEEWSRMDGDPLLRLRAVIEGHVRNNLEHPEAVGAFFHDFRSLSPARRAEIIADRDVYDRFLREIIEEGQEQGLVAADVDPKLATMAVLGMMNWVYQWYRPDGDSSPGEIARAFADLVLAGMVVGRSVPARGSGER
jgi:AcrR family transcriptional regulator